jgi:hypothetical protein
MSNCYSNECSKNCYSCKHCQSGTYTLENYTIDEGTEICVLTGNTLVDAFGEEINITACENYQEDIFPALEIEIEMQLLPF